MSSPSRLKIRCPNCEKDGSARPELINRRVSCKHCAFVFRVVPFQDARPPYAATEILKPRQVLQARELARAPDDRIEALQLEVRRLRDDLSVEHLVAVQVQAVRDQLAQALDAIKKAEAIEQSLREEVDRLHDQLDQALPEGSGQSRDVLREEELRFLRDQLDKARGEVESESRKRRELNASLNARDAEAARVAEARDREHAEAIEARGREHAEALRAAFEQLDQFRLEAESDRIRRQLDDSTRLEVERRRAEEARNLAEQLEAAREDLEEVREALESDRLDRERLEADHARVVDELRGQLSWLEAGLGDVDATRLDRDRLAQELDSHRSRLLELERSLEGHRDGAEGLRLDLEQAEAARSAELAQLHWELEAARAGSADLDAIRLERDEARTQLDQALEELDGLRSQRREAEAHEHSVDWAYPSTELEVPNADTEAATEADIPIIVQEASTIFDGNLERPRSKARTRSEDEDEDEGEAEDEAEPATIRAGFDDDAFAVSGEVARLELELEKAQRELEDASSRNRELAERIRALEVETPSPATLVGSPWPDLAPEVDPASIERERKRAVDEAVKGAWADFERRLAETQAKLRAANARADLMEMEAREAREQIAAREQGLDLGDGSSFSEGHSMTSIRILDARGTARLTPADAEARLALAKQVAVDRKDKPLIDRIGKMAEKVRVDLDARNYTLAETLVRGAEIETGLDPGGFSIAGLRIYRGSPIIVGSLAALAPAFDRVMRQGDLGSIRSTIEEMRTILGDQAGLPEIRRVGRTPAVKRPIAPVDALRLFVAALEAENWLMRPIAARKPLPDTSLTTYACLVEACSDARNAAERHDPARLPLLDGVIQASCQMLARRQQADGHFAFLDPRGRASKLGSVVEGMVAQRPDAVKDGWVVHVDPLGMAQAETGACAVALSTAGKALGRPEWSQAAQKAADWAMDQPCLPNFVANAVSAGVLARAYLDARQERHLTGLARKLTRGLLPGQVENGRWVDASSATTPNHLTILRSLQDAWEAIPSDREDLRRPLKPAIERAIASLLAECQALGVPPQGNALRDLLRHRDLAPTGPDLRLDSAILDSATVIQELCHDGPKPKLGVAPDQLAALTRV